MNHASSTPSAVCSIDSHPRRSEAHILAGSRARRSSDCPVCLGEHQEEIHSATLSVHQWFRAEVTKSFQPPVVI
ncbi:MAG TPA: hypothetical protein VJ732_11275 [Bryobacteraceae bacterium]|nr:hypothetical protein [Bryobacteraceae bacterium]